MKHRCSSSFDRISELPTSIIQTILMFLPLRDMVRTSILSRTWRSQWVTVPQLVFDDVRDLSWNDKNIANYINIVFGILLLHEGPILKFKLDVPHWDSCPVVDKIIPLLARNGIQDLTFVTRGITVQEEDESDDEHEECEKFPSSIFKCIELKHLRLESCVFKPLTLVGFHKLISAELIDVYLDPNVTIPCGPLLENLTLAITSSIDCFSVDAPNLKSLHLVGRISSIGFMNTPLVKFLSLCSYQVPSGVNLVNLLRYMPLLVNLNLSDQFLGLLAEGNSPNELPFVLNNLRLLELHTFKTRRMDQLSSTLLWIRSQPNLQKVKFWELCPPSQAEAVLNYQRLRYSDYSMKLREVEFVFLYDMRPCIEFIKFLLAISPELETLYIMSHKYIRDVDRYQNLLEITCSRRASPKAEIVCLDLDGKRT